MQLVMIEPGFETKQSNFKVFAPDCYITCLVTLDFAWVEQTATRSFLSFTSGPVQRIRDQSHPV